MQWTLRFCGFNWWQIRAWICWRITETRGMLFEGESVLIFMSGSLIQNAKTSVISFPPCLTTYMLPANSPVFPLSYCLPACLAFRHAPTLLTRLNTAYFFIANLKLVRRKESGMFWACHERVQNAVILNEQSHVITLATRRSKYYTRSNTLSQQECCLVCHSSRPADLQALTQTNIACKPHTHLCVNKTNIHSDLLVRNSQARILDKTQYFFFFFW